MLRGMWVAYVCCCGKNRNEVDRDGVEAEVQGMWKRPRGIVWRDRDDSWRAYAHSHCGQVGKDPRQTIGRKYSATLVSNCYLPFPPS